MSLRQKVRLELDDGTELTTTYDGRELRQWEARTGKSSLVEPMSLSMLTFLGWAACKRDGQLNGSYAKFEEFDKACVDVQGMRDEERPDPPKKSTARTRKTASGG